MIFCWYNGCYPQQMLLESGSKFLYILRTLNDAAIIWYESVPEEGRIDDENLQTWMSLSEQTGSTFAKIIQDITEFKPIP
jgi:hypothetical protein